MYEALLSFNRRARRVSSLALVGATLVAACDTDQPIAPKSPATATPANLSLGPGSSGGLVLKVVDKNGNLISSGTAQFKITGPNNVSWWADDNGQYDSDPAVGVLVFKSIAAGSYKACEFGPPSGYGVIGNSCLYTTVYVGATSGLFFHNGPIVVMKWTVKDNGQNYITGATFTLDSNNVVIGDIADNSQQDGDPANGKFSLPIPFETKYKLCLKTAPNGYVFPANQPACVTQDIKMGTGVADFGTFTVYPTLSASWKVTDGSVDANNQYNLIGPSTFRVSFPGGATANAVDNGNADYDPAVGRIAVQFPFAGNYTICEIVPPVNHWNAAQPCKQFTVVAGVPVDLGYFINYEKQVFKP